jgi:hypothetical protein
MDFQQLEIVPELSQGKQRSVVPKITFIANISILPLDPNL